MTYKELAARIHAHATGSHPDGQTYGPTDESFASATFSDGYFVSYYKPSLVVSTVPSAHVLGWWLSTLPIPTPRLFVGYWRDDTGRYHFDVSEYHQDRESALTKAKAERQLAIWDCEAVESIPV